ncbi:MAG: hypothetical protein WB507_14140 [Solirubrobacterales bacterium]
MREKLNSSPIAQIGVIAVLVAAAAFMLLKGGGGESSSESTATTTTTPTEVTANVNGATATAATPGAAVEGAVSSLQAGAATEAPTALPTSVPAPPLPHAVSAAYKANKIVVLLIVRKGGIDDHFTKYESSRYTKISSLSPASLTLALQKEQKRLFPHVALFVVPAKRISRYAAITVGVNVQSVPALIVVRPRHLNGHASPQAYVSYGFQTLLDVVQAVREATYRGPETTAYHPN